MSFMVELKRDQNDEFLIYPSPPVLYYDEQVSQPSSSSKISPAVLLIIVILAAVFFISGLLHLLIRFLKKRPSSSIYQSDRFMDNSGSHALQRQLQQLFRLHDSGLDQAFIDALPLFYYKDIIGLKEPFDCAVCLCEFLEHDKLRLLPLCGHAFHINCIDTWLLSNSTCPLCRGTLVNSGLSTEKPNLSSDNSFLGDVENGVPTKSVILEDTKGERMVFSVRLGKFRSLDTGNESEGIREGESSSCYLDARRCYSMGSYQYVEGKFDLQVALSSNAGGSAGGGLKISKPRGQHPASSGVGDDEGKKISGRCRGESFSVSKIWLWSKNSKFSGSSESHLELPQCNSNLRNADTF